MMNALIVRSIRAGPSSARNGRRAVAEFSKRTLMDKTHFESLIVDLLEKNLAAPASSTCPPAAVAFADAMVEPATISQHLPLPHDTIGRSRENGLLVYAQLRAIEIRRLPIQGDLFAWCSAIEALDDTGWIALALNIAAHRCGRDDWLRRSSDFFQNVIHRQQPSGALFQPDSTVNPEIRWYDELVLLHALSTYAVQTRSQLAELAVERATDFHLMETQPDHATREPWAIYAFYSNPRSRIQAEQILHTAEMQHPAAASATTLILLADALWCLQSSGCGGNQIER